MIQARLDLGLPSRCRIDFNSPKDPGCQILGCGCRVLRDQHLKPMMDAPSRTIRIEENLHGACVPLIDSEVGGMIVKGGCHHGPQT